MPLPALTLTLPHVSPFLSTWDVMVLEQSCRHARLSIPWRDFARYNVGKDFVDKRERYANPKGFAAQNDLWRKYMRDRFQNVPPVVMAIYKVTDQAGDIIEIGCESDSVYQVQLDHTSRRSVVTDIRAEFSAFLHSGHATYNVLPSNFAELQRAGIKLVVSDGSDPDGVGYKLRRVAFYVVGNETSLTALLCMLFDFVVYKARRHARKLYDVYVYPYIGINVKDFDDEHVILHAPSKDLPMGIFDAMPAVGNRVVILMLHRRSDDTIDIVLKGNTWAYRDRLHAFGMFGDLYHECGIRWFLPTLQMNLQNGGKERVWNLLGDGVFKGLSMRVEVRSDFVPGTIVHALVSDMRALPQLHFV